MPQPESSPLSPRQFQETLGISDALLQRFVVYGEILQKWQSKINLVSPATLPDLWRRHFLDSAQLDSLIPSDAGVILDIGSGAGFPGLVLALLRAEEDGSTIHLVEANQRKATFLAEVNREIGTRAVIHKRRVESIHEFKADVITARACAPMKKLLPLIHPILESEGYCLLLKGKNALEELTESQKKWKMSVKNIPSQTSDSGMILNVRNLSPKNEHRSKS